MVYMQSTGFLIHLLQFESFQETIRYYVYKANENKLILLVYAIVGIIVLTVIFRFLARKK